MRSFFLLGIFLSVVVLLVYSSKIIVCPDSQYVVAQMVILAVTLATQSDCIQK